ncbi:MAG TPA: Clp protease N-terminal domain-containing protein [Longimicrobiales bacterium]|nr:Clp protease N-terminal domain-containing protein [Longimicrobiales bacterium]
MKYNFTDDVRTVLDMARTEAIRLRHDFVSPAHMVLALISLEAPVLELPGMDRTCIRAALERTFQPGRQGAARVGELPYTALAKKALQAAMSEARARGDRMIAAEHLLLGILATDRVVAAALEGCGVTPDSLTGGVSATGRQAGAAAGGDREPEVWFLTLDAAADTPLYEQIIRAVEVAVATGKLEEGERLPTVRQLAAELEIAPGTVARAYQALEEKGVVVTEGARGTRVAPAGHRTSPDDERATALEGLFRSAVVAAYHMGAKGKEVRAALERAMKGIYGLLA